jgi:ATP-dependent RNA helicase RhlB
MDKITPMKFTELPLSEEILKGIQDAGFTECTPAQADTYQYAFAGRDVCVQSQTGTGKTAAYLVTIFKLFTDKTLPTNRALIMVPTRELAVQIDKEISLLGKYLNLRSATFFGGVGYAPQEEALERGVDILIATPGRLIDLFKSGKVKLDDVSILVIDEADRMFDMGFIPDIRYLIKKMPPAGTRRTMLFSATLSHKVKGLAWEYMQDPAEVEIMPQNITVDKITQILYHVGGDEKFKLLLGILKKHKPSNAIIFTNMKHTAEIVSKRLTMNGYPNEYIMGDLPQKKRLKVIEGVKNGEIKFLVATDVAARGLHVDDLDMVINYDVPEDCENYVHRIGRTARAGKSGFAITLACERYVQGLEAIEEYIKAKIPTEWFEDTLLNDDASAGVRFSRDNDKGRRGERDRGRPGEGRRDGGRKEGGRRDGGRRDERRSAHAPRAGAPRRDEQPRRNDGKRPFEQKKPYEQKKPFEPRQQEQKKFTPKPPQPQHGKKVLAKRDGTMEERLEYYRQKYGDDFRVPEGMLREEKKLKGKSMLARVLSALKPKKKK